MVPESTTPAGPAPADAGIPGLDVLIPGGPPPHASILLLYEGGSLAEPIGYQFILAGIAEREGLIVTVSSKALEDFLRSMASLTSLDLNQFGQQVEIIDWHSWRRDRINALEEKGHVIRCPRGLINVDIAVARANRIIRDYAKRRAYLDFLGVAVQVATPEELVGKVEAIVSRLTKDQVLALYPADLKAVSPELVDKIKDRFTAVVGLETRPDGFHLRLMFYEGLPKDGPEIRLVQDEAGRVATAPPTTPEEEARAAALAVAAERRKQGVKVQGAEPEHPSPAALERAEMAESEPMPPTVPLPAPAARPKRRPPPPPPPKRSPTAFAIPAGVTTFSSGSAPTEPPKPPAPEPREPSLVRERPEPRTVEPGPFYPFQRPGFAGWSRSAAGGAVAVVVMILMTTFLGAGIVDTFSRPYRRTVDEEASFRLEGTLTLDIAGGNAVVEVDLPLAYDLTEPSGEVDQAVSRRGALPSVVPVKRYDWDVWATWPVNATGRVEIKFWSDAVGYARTWTIAPGESGPIGNIPGVLNNQFLATPDRGDEWRQADGTFKISARDPLIRAKAADLTAGKATVLEKARAVYEFLVDEVADVPGPWSGEPDDAVSVYQRRSGRADEIGFLGVSLLRSLGIPAWMQFGAARDAAGAGWHEHAWIRFHVPVLGGGDPYVTMDPVRRQWMYRAADQVAIFQDDGDGGHLADFYERARKVSGAGSVSAVALAWKASNYTGRGGVTLDDVDRTVGYGRLDFAPGVSPLVLLVAAIAGGAGLAVALWWLARPTREVEAKPSRPAREEKPVASVGPKPKVPPTKKGGGRDG